MAAAQENRPEASDHEDGHADASQDEAAGQVQEAPEAANGRDQRAVFDVDYFGPSDMNRQIETLKHRRQEIKNKAAAASKELKKAKRKEKRLRTKAEKLDNNDLMEVFRLRAEAQAKAKEKAAAKAQAKAKAQAQP